MKTKFLLIAFLIALTISLIACDGDAPATPEVPGTTTTTTGSTLTTTTTGGGDTVTTTTTTTTTVTTTTKNGIIELPPVDVR
ncbi:MAG: hypothetical protein J6V42_01495 [Clostridia bacterium]|nr:hypothetical protein [Clostridia bacterium]